jgi:hypothetical protein
MTSVEGFDVRFTEVFVQKITFTSILFSEKLHPQENVALWRQALPGIALIKADEKPSLPETSSRIFYTIEPQFCSILWLFISSVLY